MAAESGFNTPIFIVTRDRITCVRALVGWLERHGYTRLILVDNASTYGPLVEFLDTTPHQVVRLADDQGHLAPWTSGTVADLAGGERYVVTDSDVVPADECPPDAVAFLADALDRYPIYVKAGLGLKVDDLPVTYEHAALVRAFEAQYWRRRIRRNLYQAPTDTTFAVYQPGKVWPTTRPAIRSGRPYVARHLPWYADTANPTDEDRYHLEQAQLDVVSWSAAEESGDYLVVPPAPSLVNRLRWRLWVALKNRERRP